MVMAGLCIVVSALYSGLDIGRRGTYHTASARGSSSLINQCTFLIPHSIQLLYYKRTGGVKSNVRISVVSIHFYVRISVASRFTLTIIILVA